ncbi:hypothetical protein [Sideroxydans sp. CL21]|uniref:hypothetical protein n=1 Tax=Sideroxydans sp. CL21 TaxID=2600596 RepID=UPI0024BC1106|nr:hypothetical protein [Sideroxydans sp. CL21]
MKTNTQSERARWLAFISIVGIVIVGGYFVLYPQTLFKPGAKLFDMGYNLGLAGGLMMLTLLLYPLRKRLRFAGKLGALPKWFRWHMLLGILGPLTIIFHSTYHVYIPYIHPIGSPNAAVAMFSMLLVAGSGIFGRFFYTKIHHGLYGRMSTLSELRSDLENSEDLKAVLNAAPGIGKTLEDFHTRVDACARQSGSGFMNFFTVGFQTMKLSRSLPREISLVMHDEAVGNNFSPEQRANMEQRVPDYQKMIVSYLNAVRDASQFSTYERLFSWWHIFHVPLVYLMFFSAFYHVYAVHFY